MVLIFLMLDLQGHGCESSPQGLFIILLLFSLQVMSSSATPWTAACQTPRSFTVSQGLPRFMAIELVTPSNHLFLCCPLLCLPSIFPNIRVFSNESSALHIRWPKYWSFNFSIIPSNEYSGLIPLGLTGLISLLSKGLSGVFSNTTVQKHQFIVVQPSS